MALLVAVGDVAPGHGQPVSHLRGAQVVAEDGTVGAGIGVLVYPKWGAGRYDVVEAEQQCPGDLGGEQITKAAAHRCLSGGTEGAAGGLVGEEQDDIDDRPFRIDDRIAEYIGVKKGFDDITDPWDIARPLWLPGDHPGGDVDRHPIETAHT